ncbi:hypothetical protein PINS_up011986 [Pythium insidiosum]|nr:hypothetical protein PINS_up011986 [Pythium insidiosum]
MWVDRLNHFVLPWLFRRTIHRTSQALYFDSDQLASPSFPHCGRNVRRPLTCEAAWVRFDRVCRDGNTYCRGITNVWRHVAHRLQFLRAAYPNRTLDFVVFEGMDDYTRGGFVFHGRKDQDLVAVTRLRDCSSGTCYTVAIDDYRYESAAHTTTVVDWFVIIGSLRLLGQMYVWLRLVLLILGIFHARSTEERFRHATLRARVLLTARTFFLIPSQTVIYGSVFPIACYAIAHALDSSYVYEMIAQHFRTPLGVYRFNLREVINVSAVALRSVWVMAAICHVLLTANTQRLWSPVHGVACVPAFFITLLAGPSVFAQVRSTAWRNTNVLHAYEVVPGLVPFAPTALHHRQLASSDQRHRARHDHRRAVSAECVAAVVRSRGRVGACSQGISWCREAQDHVGVSYTCWIRCWLHVADQCTDGELVTRSRLARQQHQSDVAALLASKPPHYAASDTTTPSVGPPSLSLLDASLPLSTPQIIRSVSSFARVSAIGAMQSRLSSANRITSVRLMTQLPGGSSISEHEMHTLNRRSQELESLLYLVNVAVMTEPLTFLRCRLLHTGIYIGVFRFRSSQRVVLLPWSLVVGTTMDAPIEWSDLELCGIVDSTDLRWSDLLHCG